jgi:hypothetical protein
MKKRSAMTIAGGLVAALLAGAVSLSLGFASGTTPSISTVRPEPRVRTIERTITIHKKADPKPAVVQTIAAPAPAPAAASAPAQPASDDEQVGDHDDGQVGDHDDGQVGGQNDESDDELEQDDHGDDDDGSDDEDHEDEDDEDEDDGGPEDD